MFLVPEHTYGENKIACHGVNLQSRYTAVCCFCCCSIATAVAQCKILTFKRSERYKTSSCVHVAYCMKWWHIVIFHGEWLQIWILGWLAMNGGKIPISKMHCPKKYREKIHDHKRLSILLSNLIVQSSLFVCLRYCMLFHEKVQMYKLLYLRINCTLKTFFLY